MKPHSIERQTPSNVEAEQAVLGSILLDGTALARVLNALNAQDFYLEKHRWVYEAIVSLYRSDTPIDFLSVTSHLDAQKRLNLVGGAGYLTSLLASTPTAAHCEHYAALVREQSQRRHLVQIATMLAERAYDSEITVPDAQSQTIQDLTKVSSDNRVFKNVGDIVQENPDYFYRDGEPKEVWGIPTGFIQLDRLLGGWHRGGFYVIAGNSSVGKTFFLLTILLNLAYRGVGSGLVSLEMTGVQLTERLLGMISGIPTDALHRRAIEEESSSGQKKWRKLNAQELEAEYNALETLKRLPIYINDSAIRDATQMRTALLNLKAQHPEIGVGALDYLQLMTSQIKGTRNDELANESRELKNLANEFPVFALSQKNRDSERRENRKAFKMADIRDSGGIPQDSDVLFDLYSQDYIDQEEGKIVDKPTNLVEARIAKDRLSRAKGKIAKFYVNPLTKHYQDNL